MKAEKQKQESKERSQTVKKGDFIALEFTGKQEGEVFDSNIEKEALKLNPNLKKEEIKPLILCIGHEMVVKGFDEALEGKEIGKKYSIKIQPEKAFGKRNAQLIKLVPKRAFTEHNMNPVAGMPVALDNSIAKIISVSGGRVLVDFNNPLAGKEVEYDFTIKSKIEDLKEKVNALQDFFFRNQFEFSIDEEKKKLIFKDLHLTPLLNALRGKFKETLGYDVEILAKPENKKEEVKTENK